MVALPEMPEVVSNFVILNGNLYFLLHFWILPEISVPLISTCRIYHLWLLNYLQRLGEEVPVRRVWEPRGQKKKKMGRPRQTWNQVVTKILHEKVVSWEEGKILARNKKEWSESEFVYAYEH
uniref:Uncharacterized protein n=1 Tax=Photinus pyralis TaxID=7054 RepID=A0A1Y1KAT1_PHOPY